MGSGVEESETLPCTEGIKTYSATWVAIHSLPETRDSPPLEDVAHHGFARFQIIICLGG